MNKIIWKRVHNIFGMTGALFLLVLLVTGICLNHPSLFKEETIEVLAAHPKDTKKIYAGRKDGFYLSGDGGQSWEEVPMLYPPEEVADIAFAPMPSQGIYLLEKWGRLLFSRDGGRIWEQVKIPFDPQSDGVELKKISPGPGNNLFLLTSHGYLASKDSGMSWDESHLDKKRTPLPKLLKTLHNGYFFGPAFVWFYDFAAIALLILILTGALLWNISRKTAS